MKFLLSALLLFCACTQTTETTTSTAAATTAETTSTNPPVSATTATAPPATETAEPVAEVPLLAAGPKLRKVDEASSRADFLQFRNELEKIIARRDSAALLAVVDPQIRTSFGDGGGKKAFIDSWKLEAADSKLWSELGQIVALGGSFQGEGFWAPYVYSKWPDDVDAFEHVAAVCADTSVREKNDSTATPVVRLDHHIVKIGTNDPMRKGDRDPAWREVILPDGRSGWVEARCVRSPIGYRAGFAKKDGKWMLNALVAGD